MKKPNKHYTCYGTCYCDYTPTIFLTLNQYPIKGFIYKCYFKDHLKSMLGKNSTFIQ